jgi:hypothetical protein
MPKRKGGARLGIGIVERRIDAVRVEKPVIVDPVGIEVISDDPPIVCDAFGTTENVHVDKVEPSISMSGEPVLERPERSYPMQNLRRVELIGQTRAFTCQ